MKESMILGRVEVAPSAIASLAGQAVLECYGVVGMAAVTLRHGLAELLHPESYRRGVEVTLQDGKIIIDLYVIIEYGTRISEVAQNIMENVKFQVERSLGVPIHQINVHVQGLRVSEQD
ncbi:MAG: Asp23/Gls24 family envelope stress response protein [Chloroflexi bacterium]|nr:Asp23/Gls24 family envelope stress response protein [Chloroflexota bacterium]